MSPTIGSRTRPYSPSAASADRLIEVDSPMTARSPAQNRVMAARLAAVGSAGRPGAARLGEAQQTHPDGDDQPPRRGRDDEDDRVGPPRDVTGGR